MCVCERETGIQDDREIRENERAIERKGQIKRRDG